MQRNFTDPAQLIVAILILSASVNSFSTGLRTLLKLNALPEPHRYLKRNQLAKALTPLIGSAVSSRASTAHRQA
ncbi:MAG: hypothetical protein AB8B87_22860 [Granulosicoccus sp.]